MRIKCTDFFEKWGLYFPFRRTEGESEISWRNHEKMGEKQEKWGKKRNAGWEKRWNWCWAKGRLRTAFWLGASICNAKSVFQRKHIRLIPRLNQIEKLCFLVLSVSHNVLLCNWNCHSLPVYHPRVFLWKLQHQPSAR